MVFVMDESGSITEENFERMKQLAINITSSFQIAPDRTRVGWVSFNDTAWVVFSLTEYQSKESLQDAIRGIKFSGGFTGIGEGLNTLRLEGFNDARNSFDIHEVAIVVTDGITNRGINTSYAAELLRQERNVNVFAIGVGDGVNDVELTTVASAGIESDRNHIYHIDDFGLLMDLQQILGSQACAGESLAHHPCSFPL